jgi:hypothetical protein
MSDERDEAYEQAGATMRHISSLVAYLSFSADSLADLIERGVLEAIDDVTTEEEARECIHELPLSVEVRSGWVNQGEEMVAEEFNILLTTGGPAIRIMGELDASGSPSRAWIQYSDWGTPWANYFGPDHDPVALLGFSRQFFE